MTVSWGAAGSGSEDGQASIVGGSGEEHGRSEGEGTDAVHAGVSEILDGREQADAGPLEDADFVELGGRHQEMIV